jgi:hypothetical protein
MHAAIPAPSQRRANTAGEGGNPVRAATALRVVIVSVLPVSFSNKGAAARPAVPVAVMTIGDKLVT